ncbi:tetratricopeptide repeat protein [Hydrogenophaga sp. PAMC20947]|uniref:tetratricopeptide repeat protein n=1 Tax=Hydrogenophaga sp. PAMC20947 TaxID=2565558 RepID=UPI00109DE14D|nr:tetratricopeptide repeat protein [Hydrogenophaga sp. PAMC20947]QCB46551.1 tetratricopeptide repeat protein [Hydrogenophaga sp. PAMC20947]
MNTLHSPVSQRTSRLLPARRLLQGLISASLLLAAGGAWAQAKPAVPETISTETAWLNSSLTAPLFYQLLLGELNVQSGDPGTGYSLFLDAARKQRSEELYQRAVDIALQARSGDAALTAAQAWSKDLLDSNEADRFVLQILLALNRPGDTGPVLRSLLKRTTGSERNDTINAIPLAFARVVDKPLALKVVRESLALSLEQPESAAAAWTTIGRMELGQDLETQALASARKGQAANSASVFPALLGLELMERGVDGAEAIVVTQLKASPPPASSSATTPSQQSAVALTYARILLDLQRNPEARAQLEGLTAQQPKLAEPWLLLATLDVQDNRLPNATRDLETYMGLARTDGAAPAVRGLTQAYLLMAQIAEKQKDFTAANAWLDRIENAEDIMAAQMRRASLLARQGQMKEARAMLRNQPERRPDDARLKLVVEGQLLRDFKAWQDAFDVYGEAVKRFPEDDDLLYDQAMMAEKIEQLDTMEQLLRKLIARKPDHHHAYNALGYSLAERGQRLPEAKALIEKAVELEPNDAYIQDSLGWVEFRMGNATQALSILKAAYTKRPDPEIAAHLGEVLWSQGQQDEAKRVWREGLLLSSDNETLHATLKRLKVTP